MQTFGLGERHWQKAKVYELDGDIVKLKLFTAEKKKKINIINEAIGKYSQARRNRYLAMLSDALFFEFYFAQNFTSPFT